MKPFDQGCGCEVCWWRASIVEAFSILQQKETTVVGTFSVLPQGEEVLSGALSMLPQGETAVGRRWDCMLRSCLQENSGKEE